MIPPCQIASTLHASPQIVQQSQSHQLSDVSQSGDQILDQGQKQLQKQTLQQNTALALYNLIKLEKKNSSFVFYGFQLDDNEPQIDFTQCFNFENPIYNQNLFKYFWKLIDFKYFSTNLEAIEHQYEDLYQFFEEAVYKNDKSAILISLTWDGNMNNSNFKDDFMFWAELKKTFSKDFLKAEFKIHLSDFESIVNRKNDRYNLIQRLRIIWKIIENQQNEKKLEENLQLKRQQKERQHTQNVSSKQKLNYQSLMKKLNNAIKSNQSYNLTEPFVTSSRNRSLSSLRKLSTPKNINEKILQNERKVLQSIFEELQQIKDVNENDEDQLDQISKQILKYERQLQESSAINQQMITKLRSSMSQILTGGEALLPYDENSLTRSQKFDSLQIPHDKKKQSVLYRGTRLIDQKKFIQKTVNNLQLQLIAESISKIYALRKIKDIPTNAILITEDKENLFDEQRNWFQIEFQKNLGFPSHEAFNKVIIDENLLIRLNKIRQHSLFTFYNTAFKSKYTYMSHSQVGFNMIYQRPTVERVQNIKWIKKLTPTEDEHLKNIKRIYNPGSKPLRAIDMIILDPDTRTNVAFQKKQLCHHCRLLCPQEILFSCQNIYTLDISHSLSKESQNAQQSIEKTDVYPVNMKVSYQQDEFYNQGNTIRTLCEDPSSKNKSKSHSYRHKCAIKYCRYCINNSYQGQNPQDGICFLCKGECLCSRCEKNEARDRLISWYNSLGGDVKKIQINSNYKKLFINFYELKNHQNFRKNYEKQEEKKESFLTSDNKVKENKELQKIKTEISNVSPKALQSDRSLRQHKYINHNPSYQKIKQPIVETKPHEPKSETDIKNITSMISGLRNLEILCKLTKKRQTLKLQLIENRRQVFYEKVKLIEQRKSEGKI